MIRCSAAGLVETGTRTSSVTAGPACAHRMVRRFTFAVADGRSLVTRTKRRTAVFHYVIGWTGAVIVEERVEDTAGLCLACGGGRSGVDRLGGHWANRGRERFLETRSRPRFPHNTPPGRASCDALPGVACEL